jgi:hypothetical protein
MYNSKGKVEISQNNRVIVESDGKTVTVVEPFKFPDLSKPLEKPRDRKSNYTNRVVTMRPVTPVDARHGTDAEIQIGTLRVGLSGKEFMDVLTTMQRHLADNPELLILAKK